MLRNYNGTQRKRPGKIMTISAEALLTKEKVSLTNKVL